MKRCTKCETSQPLTNYYNNKANKDGLYGTCKRCHDKSVARYKLNHPEVQVKANFNHKLGRHGIDFDTFNGFLDRQGGVCAICSRAETTKRKSGKVWSLSVDLNESGEVRGLLCFACIRMIRTDDFELLIKAAEYVKNNGVLNPDFLFDQH